jgi:hypothetical protein
MILQFGLQQGLSPAVQMADRIGTEASGLPLIATSHLTPTCEGESPGHIAINVENDVVNPQKSTLSEEQLKLSELEKADMSIVRKRSGMKVIFRVRLLAQISCIAEAQETGYPWSYYSAL